MKAADEILDETTGTGRSVRANMWTHRAIGLAQLESMAFWVADAEYRAARRARRG